MTPLSLLLIGHDSLTRECGARALVAGHRIAAVVTREPAVSDWAHGAGLSVIAPGAGLADRCGTLSFDWLLSVANLDLLPEALIAQATRGAVNFHDGPLPRHAGLNAPVWAIAEGETRHGISWHMIEGGVDEGDLLATREVAISADETALSLNLKCFAAGLESFDAVLSELSSDAPRRVPQDLSLRTYHARADRPGVNGCLDSSEPAAVLERLVRALDHGDYANPLCVPKLLLPECVAAVSSAARVERSGAPGEILSREDAALVIACKEGAMRLSGLRSLDGNALVLPPVGTRLERPGPEQAIPLGASDHRWRRIMADVPMARLKGAGAADGSIATRDVTLSPEALAVHAARTEGGPVALAYRSPKIAEADRSHLSEPWVPVRVDAVDTLCALSEALNTEIATARRSAPMAIDIWARLPGAKRQVPAFALSDAAGPVPGAALTLERIDRGTRVHIDTGRLPEPYASILIAALEDVSASDPDAPLRSRHGPSAAERTLVTETWNDTAREVEPTTIHALFAAQVARTPDATALVCDGESLSYAELDARANRAAHVLQGMGVGPDIVVGLCCARSPDLLIGALAILKAGGAYLPLDPAYPADRLRHYASDSAAPVIVTQSSLAQSLPETGAQTLCLDSDPRLSQAAATAPQETSGPGDLAYLIYTSGSTGTPKGVMVEHRNVVNFFAGMDEVVRDQGGTWLSVTSLSFDISVLEIFYTLARGFKVVMSGDESRALISGDTATGGGGMEFSLYYWGNDDGVGPEKYKTLIEGAKFADDHGFCAVWTPERHFHAFGGPYPNPSVTGAAVAGVTKRIGVRAGSCVAPLHHPARIAEEWAVIDNLTNGRAGLAIASGWQPDDFVLRPENTPPANKPAMIESIETLRKLWRGEAVGFPRADGSIHEVVTQPRPVSSELPVWVTTAGNPETWREAGRLGANVLTHLLGQSVAEVGEKIALYHEALREAGHDPAQFTVTLMLHSFIAETRDAAREIAREPMKDYLRSAAGLIKQYAWAFPAFKKPDGVKNPFELDLGSLSPDELEGILDFAFERYFNDSGLFGTVEDALARVDEVRAIGVTEIACLIDYGIAADTVLDGLRPLAEVVEAANRTAGPAEDDFSIAAQIQRHGVTHLQCTPSMARMIAMNDEARAALGRVSHLYLGGEPLPGALVEELRGLTSGSITNMYGPTETTIWSSSEPVETTEPVVNIGRPLANQMLYVLDAGLVPVGIGEEGELWIGGDGVTRGYWGREALTAERFVDNPFHKGRMYRTGDLVRRRADGRIDFVGRVDHQVKIRGHRIELGEVEAALEALDGVSQAVALVRQDQPGDTRLVGYYTGAAMSERDLKDALSSAVPAIMVPQHLLRLDAFPLTPNKKVDRGALPAPTARRVAEPVVAAMPSTPKRDSDAGLEARVAEIWSRILGVDGIGAKDNFFELGGHSLLAVQAHRTLRDELGAQKLAITDVFRFPVLGQLSARIAEILPRPDQPSPAKAPAAEDTVPAAANERAQARSDAMARRRAMRARRSA
ncbi:MupA/Atu3671 family FMN-dependent luciferase-like monooxygenase [Litorisediminicola beolgyonensis]|uniref:MupA/Atu3671 family FMN-dependent luciferase-like monooxygenase n=1 Tax=Litorisediminicola beolgyonensis TaxID=1173614 RepID=A0ABW3ZHK6_9RHOB